MKQTKNTKSVLALTSIALATLLTACGGGGGSTSTPTDPVVKTCANGANDYPTCKFFVAELQSTVPAPPYVAGSDELAAFNFLNDERAANGLGKVAYNEALTKAAMAHANYLYLNKWLGHDETAGNPGFTGTNPVDRALAAGYTTNSPVNEVLGLANSRKGGVQSLIDTVYHRSIIFGQSWVDVGMGSHCYDKCDDKRIFDTIEFGYKKKQRNASDFFMTYPRNGQDAVRPIFCGESPWPLETIISMTDACKLLPPVLNQTVFYDAKVGYPILVSVAEGRKINITKFEIYESGPQGNSAAIPAWLLTSSNDVNTRLQSHEAYLIPKQSLKLDTLYTVTFVGTSDDLPISRTWTFRSDTVQVRFN